MAVDPTSGTSGAINTGVSSVTKKDQLGQDQFLQLMLAQLKNQDPFKPTDPTQFLSQLAQFSTVTGIQSMQSSVESLADSLRSSAVLDGAALVGHDVLAASDEVTLGAAGSSAATARGAIEVPENATKVSIIVKDASGQLVRQMEMPKKEGMASFTWDGNANNGARAAAGTYTIEAIADVGGKSVSIETELIGRVSSVTIDPTNYSLTLNTELGPMALANVRRVM